MLPGAFPGEANEPQSYSTESGGSSGENILCDQIRDIVDALHDIRAQLAEQNKYLDVLTEKYVKPPAQIVYEDGWETEEENEAAGFDDNEHLQWESNQWDDEDQWNDESDTFVEEESLDIPVPDDARQLQFELSKTPSHIEDEICEEKLTVIAGEPSKEPVLAIGIDDHNLHPSGFTDATGYYLTVGLVASLVCMHLFHGNGTHSSSSSQNTNTVMLLLVFYALATWALWFLRDAQLVRRVLGAWKPSGSPQVTQRTGRSRLPELMMG
ncbi:hypothetical protein BDV06DRAFT_182700 [Aspergillus oleicola]